MTPHVKAKALLSGIVNARPTVVSMAATEAIWQHKYGKLSRDALVHVIEVLKFMGWEGEMPDLPPPGLSKEERYRILYSCKACGRSVDDVSMTGSEVELTVELHARERRKAVLHSDMSQLRRQCPSDYRPDGSLCRGILTPIAIIGAE